MTDLSGKTAFIAGGTNGINLGIALGLAAHGANVALVGRDVDKARRAANMVEGGLAIGLSADVRSFEAVEGALKQTADRWGPVDFVVSGAAGNFIAPALGMSAKGFRTVVDIDLIGTFNVFRAAYTVLRRPGASLLAISAGQAVQAVPGQAHVCAAKAGINMLVKCLALEWGPTGVRVNALSPGPVAGTEGMRRLTPTPEAEHRMMMKVPLRRYATREEIARAALFLLSDDASYVNGAILDCDGGLMAGDATAVPADPSLHRATR
jgi:NAD(P)-dependent dehydrogenase (short-subunit alcohol dehydrogenase family)